MSNDDFSAAIGSLAREMVHSNWQGRTYRQFWDWFNSETARIEALSDDDEIEEVRQVLLDLRDSAHDGFGVPEERVDETVGPELEPGQLLPLEEVSRTDIPEDVLERMDQFKRDFQLSAWRGKHYSEYDAAYQARLEELVALAHSDAQAEAIRMDIKGFSSYEGSDSFTDENGILTWEG